MNLPKELCEKAIAASNEQYILYESPRDKTRYLVLNLEVTDVLADLVQQEKPGFDPQFVIGISSKFENYVENCITVVGDDGDDDWYIALDSEAKAEVKRLLDIQLKAIFGANVEELCTK